MNELNVITAGGHSLTALDLSTHNLDWCQATAFVQGTPLYTIS